MIDKEKAHEIADRYLIEYVGNLIGPGEPVFDNKISMWIVPVFHMSKVAVFPMGEMIIDTKGSIVHVRIVEGSSGEEKKKLAEWMAVLEKPEEISKKAEKDFQELLTLSESALAKIWSNKEDEVWNSYTKKR